MKRYAEFLAGLERGVGPLYVLAGGERLLRQEAEAAIARAVFRGMTSTREAGPPRRASLPPAKARDVPAYGLVVLKDSPERPLDAAAVLDELRSVPLFSSGKVVAVRDAGALLAKAEDALVTSFASAHHDHAAGPPGGAVLVLHVPGWKRRSRALGKLDRWAVDCSPLYESAYGEIDASAGSPLGRWVASRAGGRGLRLQADAARRLIELVGTDLSELASAVERLALSRKGKGPLGVDAVEKIIPPTRAHTCFKIADLVQAGRFEEALASANAAFETGLAERGRTVLAEGAVEARVMWAVWTRLNELYLTRGLLEEGGDVAAGLGELGVPPWRHEGLKGAARRFSLAGLAGALRRALGAELAVKTGSAAPRQALTRFLVGTARAARRAASQSGRGTASR